MKGVRRLRPFMLFCGVLLALVPMAASASKSTPAQEAANRDARCGLVLSGQKVPGKLTAAQCSTGAAGLVAGVEVRALATLPGEERLTVAQQKELANKRARCALVLAGTQISGHLTAAECAAFAPAAAAGGEVRALASLAGPRCPLAPGQSMNRVQKDAINAFAHAKVKAESKHNADPAPSDEVAALLAC